MPKRCDSWPNVRRAEPSRSSAGPRTGAWGLVGGLSMFGTLTLLMIAAPWLVDQGGPWCQEHPQVVRWLPFGPQCLRTGEARRGGRPSFVGPVRVHPGRLEPPVRDPGPKPRASPVAYRRTAVLR